jgi:hypothetical protein
VPETRNFSAQSQPIKMSIRYSTLSGQSNVLSMGVGTSNNTKSIAEKPTENIDQTPLKDPVIIPESETPNYFSLIIGINDYQNNNAELRDLNYAVGDAFALEKTLSENFGFDKTKSSFLINPTRSEVMKELEKLASTITPKDNLLIFYAGHGVWDERIKVGYWLPSDASSSEKSNWISNSTIRDYLAAINSKHTLLVTDACFSGSIFQSRGSSELSALGMSSLYHLTSRKAITSGTLTTVPDQSKFMYYFLKRLKEVDEQYTSAKQLFYSIETAILNNSRTVPQFGVIQDTGDEGGDFIFIKKN